MSEDNDNVNKIHSEISTAAKSLKILYEDWFDRHVSSTAVLGFGACGTCQNLDFALGKERRVKMARCSEFTLMVSAADPVIECSRYEKVGALSLRDMAGMATLIDPKEPVGFRKNES